MAQLCLHSGLAEPPRVSSWVLVCVLLEDLLPDSWARYGVAISCSQGWTEELRAPAMESARDQPWETLTILITRSLCLQEPRNPEYYLLHHCLGFAKEQPASSWIVFQTTGKSFEFILLRFARWPCQLWCSITHFRLLGPGGIGHCIFSTFVFHLPCHRFDAEQARQFLVILPPFPGAQLHAELLFRYARLGGSAASPFIEAFKYSGIFCWELPALSCIQMDWGSPSPQSQRLRWDQNHILWLVFEFL